MKKLIKSMPFVGSLLKTLKYKLFLIKNHLKIKIYLIQNKKLKIVIGSANIYEDIWCPTSIENLNLLEKKSFDSLFNYRKVDVFLAEHVWEHLTLEEGRIAAENCYSYLKRGGYIRVAVPDGFHSNVSYIKSVDIGGTGEGSDDHKVLYNYKTLSKIFESAGFKVEVLEYFDEDNNFCFTNWDKEKGLIHRSKRYDKRNKENQLSYTSIIIDAYKV